MAVAASRKPVFAESAQGVALPVELGGLSANRPRPVLGLCWSKAHNGPDEIFGRGDSGVRGEDLGHGGGGGGSRRRRAGVKELENASSGGRFCQNYRVEPAENLLSRCPIHGRLVLPSGWATGHRVRYVSQGERIFGHE